MLDVIQYIPRYRGQRKLCIDETSVMEVILPEVCREIIRGMRDVYILIPEHDRPAADFGAENSI
jgi:hypothetical protein